MGGEGERWCVVTGGRGFAARHLVEMLIRNEMFSVCIADLGPSIKMDPAEENGILGEAMRSGRVEYVSTDLRDKAQVLKAFEGAEVVFHMASPDSSINNHELHQSVNVKGTKNVIDSCIELNVKRLIYTSSTGVVFDGAHGMDNVDESLPYPAKHNDSYSATKAEGEAMVIKANGNNGLLTCCIRPSPVFGPGDKLFVPYLVSAASTGKMKFIIGDGNNKYDFTYVENVAHAHICAERALASDGEVAERAAGEVFIVTNMEPIKFWEFLSLILEGLGYQRPKIKIPVAVLMPIAHVVEGVYKLFAPYGMKVPQFTPSRMRLMSCNGTFSCSKANELLGYAPIVPLQDALKRTIESFSHLSAECQSKKDGCPSKASVYLGRGRVADILLWRDKKQTLTTAFILFAIYFNFIASRYTIISAIANLLLGTAIFLLIHGLPPQKMWSYTIEKVPCSSFPVSEKVPWNSLFHGPRSLSKGKDWTLFILVVLTLTTLSIVGAMSLDSVFTKVLIIAVVAFYLYEKKEEGIDGLFCSIFSFGCRFKYDSSSRCLKSKKL